MPAYLVEIPSNKRVQDVDTLVVFAADVAGARSAAAGHFSGDAAAIWNTLATVTEVVAGTDLADAGSGWSGYVRISGGAAQTVDPLVVEVDGLTRDQAQGILGANRLHVGSSITINGGGTGYAADDIITISGGTFTRAATARVTTVSTGVITGIELVDPGEYSVLPTLSSATTTNDGAGNDDADLDFVQADVGSYEAILAQLVTGLNAQADIAGAAVDFSEGASGARLFTAAAVSDGIGDATLEVEIRQNGTAFAPLVSTITHEGVAAAVLTAAIPASPLAPANVTALKS